MLESASQGALPRSPQYAADPAILERIGSAVAPVGVPDPVAPPSTMPGSVGVLAALKAMHGTFHQGVVHQERMRERYGDVHRTMYWAQPMVAVSAPDEIQKILRNEQSVWSTAMGWEFLFFDGLNVEGGNPGSLLTFDFDVHRGSRRLVQPAFATSVIRGYIDIVRPLFEQNISGWIADGRVALKPVLYDLFPLISNRMLTGIEDTALLRRMDRALRHISFGGHALVRKRYLNPLFRKARDAYGYLTSYFVPLVQERRARPGTDLFSQVCVAGGGDDRLSDHDLVRLFLTMMLGAHDSTALGITNLAYLLAKHPEWQERLRDEADAVPSDALDWKGLQKLELLECAWKESLRVIPVTDFVPRRALRDVEIQGHLLKAGTLVGPLAGCVGRHPDWWTNPLQFDPERFAPPRSEHKKHPAIWNPFGGGAHVCIGMQLATLEAKVFFHSLLTRSRFKLRRDYTGTHSFRPLGCISGDVALELDARR